MGGEAELGGRGGEGRFAGIPGIGQGVRHFSSRGQPRRCSARAPSAALGPGCTVRGSPGQPRLSRAALQGGSLHALAVAARANRLLPPRRRAPSHAPGGRLAPGAAAPGCIVVASAVYSLPRQDSTPTPTYAGLVLL